MNKFILTSIVCLAIFSVATPFKASAQYDSIFFSGKYRTFLLHLPNYYTTDAIYPLVIAMHGGLGNAYNMQNQSQLSLKADAENFIVVYPEGLKGGLLNVSSWNAGWCCGNSSQTNVDDVGFINALMDTLLRRYLIDSNKIFATGMSNGGFMSYRLACELSNRIAAIAPVSASISLNDCSPKRKVPIIHFQSYIDTSVPYTGGIGDGISNHYNPPTDSVLNVWAKNNLCTLPADTIINTDEYTFISYANCNCNANIQVYFTQDGGHSWPGGKQTPIGDEVSSAISATDLMWEFFKQHPLNYLSTGINSALPKNSTWFIYPNPTKGKLNIQCDYLPEQYEVKIINCLGKIMLAEKNTQSYNISDYPAGIYYLKIETLQNNSKLPKSIIKPQFFKLIKQQ